MAPTINTAELIKFFFEQHETEKSLYYCQNEKCKPRRGRAAKAYRNVQRRGYTNLRNHLRSCVGEDYEQVYLDHLKKAGGVLDSFCFSSSRDNDAFKLIEWVVMRNQPICEVDNSITRGLMNVSPLSSKTLRKYILSLVPLVEDAIKERLPTKFAIMFDGWTDSHMHYVAIFATYMYNGKYCETMLACGPVMKEDELTAQQHIDFLEATLDVYKRSLSNVVCLIGDNCSVNCKIASDTSIPLIGCASHKFNLAVEHWIDSQKDLRDALKALRELMVQVRTVKNCARLRELTHLGAILPNETRWTGKFEMTKRFIRIETLLQSIPSLDSSLPSLEHRRALKAAIEDFENFESIAVSLQSKGLTIAIARYTFDRLCEDYSSMSYYLSPDANIVHDKIFEGAVVKIINGNETQLSFSEKASVSKLITSSTDSEVRTDNDEKFLTYYERLEAKRRRLEEAPTQYMNSKFISATSSSVERCFSAARWILTCLRKRMSPILFEAILFLKLNRELWDLKLVSSAMRIRPKERYTKLDDDAFYPPTDPSDGN